MPGMGSVNPWGMECLIFNSSGKAMAARWNMFPGHDCWHWWVSLPPKMSELNEEGSLLFGFRSMTRGAFAGLGRKFQVIAMHWEQVSKMRLLFNVFGWMTAMCPSPPVLVRCEMWSRDACHRWSPGKGSGLLWALHMKWGGVQCGLPITDASACAASIIVESWWVEFPETSMSPAELTDYDRRLRGKRPSQEELRSTSTWKDEKPVFSGTFGFATSCGGSKPGAWWPCPAGCSLVAIAVAFVQGEINLHVRSAPVTCSGASVSGVDYQ